MDPISQAILGTTISQRISKQKQIIIASIIGTLSAMSPDLDIFIRSSEDPLLFLEYHRQFTHSLLFIPFGGLICGCFFYYTFTKNYYLTFKETYLYCTAGYATHGILDSFTSYGTQLLWPFTNYRSSLDLISIIDPIFTIPIIILCLFGVIKKDKKYSLLAISWIVVYLTISYIQQYRAEIIIRDIAEKRNHIIKNIVAKPSFANIIVWKVIYTTNSHFHVDAIKLGIVPKIYEGESVKKINMDTDFQWLDKDSQQYKDIQRFNWFSSGYIGLSKVNENIIYDIRFSSIPYQMEGLWGIKLSRTKKKYEHVEYITNRKSSSKRYNKLINMILD